MNSVILILHVVHLVNFSFYRVYTAIIAIMNFWSVFGFDANQSTISGVASGDALIINQTYTLTVQAKDSSGNNLAASGEDLYVYISDPCTRGPNMS